MEQSLENLGVGEQEVVSLRVEGGQDERGTAISGREHHPSVVVEEKEARKWMIREGHWVFTG